MVMGDWAITAAQSGSLVELVETLPSLEELCPAGTLEAAAALCADSDTLGIETERLVILVRLIAYLTRTKR